MGESDHGVDGEDFDLGRGGGGQGGLEVFYGAEEEARIKGGEVKGKGFALYGDGKKKWGGIEREK